MTGYGKAECLLADKKLTIEIKSLNSKQLDTNTRLPSLYKDCLLYTSDAADE